MMPSRNKRVAAPVRDEERELVWLQLAELEAGACGFAEHARRRLAAGQHLYGDQWARATLGELVDELSEEAADLGSWGVLALQALERLDVAPEYLDLGAAKRDLIATSLQATILWGAFAHHALKIARDHLDAFRSDERG